MATNNVESRVLTDTLGPLVDKGFQNKSNIRRLLNAITRYSDKWSSILLSTNLSKRLIHTDEDKRIIYDTTGVHKSDVTKAIRNTPIFDSSWKLYNNEFYMLCIQIARWFRINNMIPEMHAIMVYMGYVMYSSAHTNSFKHLPNEEIMNYTINNLSNRFIIKQYGTIQSCIEHTIGEAISGLYDGELVRGNDIDIKNILSGLQTRMHAFMNNIAEKFYENHKSGKYLWSEDEDLSEENFHLSDNVSYKIDRIVQLVSSSITETGFDYNVCIRRSCSMNSGASEKKVASMLDTIVEKDRQSIPKVISDILTLFMYKGNHNTINDVGTMRFLAESLQIYKSNAQDEITSRIKEKLLYWIQITSEKYGRNFISKGKTSLDTYRRAIYTAFVFKIMDTVKR